MIIHTHNMVALHGMRTIIQTNWYTQKKVVILISDMKKEKSLILVFWASSLTSL
jgi:hypothetical protein